MLFKSVEVMLVVVAVVMVVAAAVLGETMGTHSCLEWKNRDDGQSENRLWIPRRAELDFARTCMRVTALASLLLSS